MEHEWLAERRDLFLKNIVKDFFECFVFFKDLKEHTARFGVRYDGFDFWVGTEENKGKLWQLKDLCHLLWVEDDEGEQDGHGIMFDWMVGAIFHEAMKLKENAYMFERYRGSFSGRTVHTISEHGAGEVDRFFEEMTQETNRCLGRIEWLFEQAERHLFEVMQKERENSLLVRFLLEAEEEDDSDYKRPNSMGPKKLLRVLFPRGLQEAYCLAGESYLEGGWFQEARDSFEKALSLDDNCTEAMSGLRLLEKRLKELASFVNRELGYGTSRIQAYIQETSLQGSQMDSGPQDRSSSN